MTDPKSERTKRDALELEVKGIKAGLNGWNFFHGSEQGRGDY